MAQEKDVQNARPMVTAPHWNVFSIPFFGSVSLGNYTQYDLLLDRVMVKGSSRLFVGIVGRGAYVFHDAVHWTYVQEKLGIGEADARNLADLINVQLGETFAKPYGNYHAALCRDS